MKIHSVRIKNFLTFDEKGIDADGLSDLTYLVGPNGSGKSSFLKAIEYVTFNYNKAYTARNPVLKTYMHNQDTSKRMEITIGATLSDKEKELALTAFLLALEIDSEPNEIQRGQQIDRYRATEIIHRGIKMCSAIFEQLIENGLSYTLSVLPGTHRESYSYVGFETIDGPVYLANGDRLSRNPGPSDMWGSMELASEIYKRLNSRTPEIFLPGPDSPVANDETISEVTKSIDINWILENVTDLAATPRSLYLHAIEFERQNKYWKLLLDIEDLVELEEYVKSGNYATNRLQATLHDILFSMLSSSISYLTDARTKLASMGASHPWFKTNGTQAELTNDLTKSFYEMRNSADVNERKRYKRIQTVMHQLSGVNVDIVVESREISQVDKQSEPKRFTVPALVFDEEKISYPATVAAAGYCELLSVLYAVYGPTGSTILLDEPAMNIHPVKQRELLDAILSLSKEAGNNLIVVTHSPALIRSEYLETSLRFTLDTGKTIKHTLKFGKEVDKLRKLIELDPAILGALFARKVVLVEGGQELLALPEWFRKCKDWLDLDTRGIILLDVHGDTQFPKYAHILETWNVQYRLIGDTKASKELAPFGDLARTILGDDFSDLLKKHYQHEFDKAKKSLGARNDHDPLIARMITRDMPPPKEIQDLWDWLRPFVEEG